MTEALRVLFWLWLTVSLCVYAYRLVRRVTRGGKSADTTSPVDADRAPPSPTGATGPLTSAPPATPGPEAGLASAAETGRSGLFAARPDAARRSDPSTLGRRTVTVAEALAGIAMPAGLVPVVRGDGDNDPYRVAFSTSGVAPADVGAAVGDELERLGFAVRSIDETTAEATRGTTLVHVTVHANPEQLLVGTERSFPLAQPGDVVVEFRT